MQKLRSARQSLYISIQYFLTMFTSNFIEQTIFTLIDVVSIEKAGQKTVEI